MKILIATLTLVLLAAGFCLLLAYPFMVMWNYAVVEAVSVARPITYWPAFCLMMFLSLFLVKSGTSS